MIRACLLMTAIFVATPASAQAGAAPQDNPAQPAAPGNAVSSIVDTEFPAYDQNHDGQLDKAEFSRWMVALKDQEMKATGNSLAPAEVTAWADGAFVTADADKSATISKPELIAYLSGGAG
ncbi:EF-hand domain-containing protein [Sphingobium sp. JS3065]|uniref:EF-hand domain-containing protein n=1 Tax=Sphingobium sp. JS3065 TaxID=2970925 RepID=UPI00226471C4|nr:EF-hand domain-containing protein [Sphingobium sp. JS3065]UZW55781.1 EF-hand domain-containing protein [Sphingobium sp. JS3065]